MLKLLSLAALLLMLIPSLVYAVGGLSLDAVKWTSLAGTISWFAVTPLWMGRPAEMADEVVVP